jgi:hypothetical protein
MNVYGTSRQIGHKRGLVLRSPVFNFRTNFLQPYQYFPGHLSHFRKFQHTVSHQTKTTTFNTFSNSLLINQLIILCYIFLVKIIDGEL